MYHFLQGMYKNSGHDKKSDILSLFCYPAWKTTKLRSKIRKFGDLAIVLQKLNYNKIKCYIFFHGHNILYLQKNNAYLYYIHINDIPTISALTWG